MKKVIIGFWAVLFSIGLCGTSVNAFEMPLGDMGKPADYEETMKDFRQTLYAFDTFVDQLPTAFNWSDEGVVTLAKDQGSCGSCWAFASVGAFESKILIVGGPEYDTSEQQQVSCNTSMMGCSGGSMDALKFWHDVGPMIESCTGYCACNASCFDYDHCDTLSYNTTGYYTVNTGDTAEIKTSLYNDGPTYFRFNVYSDFSNFWSTYFPGNVYTHSSGDYRGGHAVLIIGWDDSKNAWLCKNSWGATSGPNGDGTFWIAYSGHAHNLDFGMANCNINIITISELNIYALKKSHTGSNSTEVHILNGATNYQSWLLHTRTVLHETDDNFDFIAGD